MHENRFYKDHWITIGQERLDRYQRMFEWSPASKVFYEAADIQAGHIVAEFGCGPGHTAIEIAGWVGPDGHVHALDINATFVAQTQENVRKARLPGRVTAHESDGSKLPLPDGSLDRVTTKNTLIYVDDPMVTFGEFKRVLRPGGKVHAIEGDWPMMVVEPVPTKAWQALASAAAHVCRTPEIGRKLTGLLARSGFRDIEVQVITQPDMEGRLLPMIKNMAGYARDGGDMANEEIDGILSTLDQALTEKTYLVLAPQFVVTGLR
ncbi:MAG: methyltransferase domain-containing protein [Proteobacteria bacterium]|nr:methyltransferase domain-containing protein [Pseudomonadota bacterium]